MHIGPSYNHLCLCSYDDDPDEPSDGVKSSDISWREEEQASLRQSLRTLQTQFASERARREESEREAELLAGENAALEQQVAGMEGCRVGVTNIYQHTYKRNRESMWDFCPSGGLEFLSQSAKTGNEHRDMSILSE